MAPDNDYYAVLGVSPEAGADQIRKAFRERVRACHPDRVAGLDEDLQRLAEEKMVKLNEAYAVLRNPARRAAYDDRHAASNAAPSPTRSAPGMPTASRRERPLAAPRRRDSPGDPAEARNRIGEQRFVARAAAEEFQLTVRHCLTGHVSWTPLAFPGATLAVRGTRGRNGFRFVLLAAPQIDDKALRRYLRSLEASGAKLKAGLLGRDRLFGFVGAVEFIDPGRQRATLDRFNGRRTRNEALRPATLVDLVNWHVVPGEIAFKTRLENLLRGG